MVARSQDRPGPPPAFLIHFTLSVIHPLMKGAIDGIVFGWMPEVYVKHHDAQYYQELQTRKG